MISATTFSRGYSSFWQEVAPWLNSYVVNINNIELTRIGHPIDSLDKPEHRAINNLTSFIQFMNEKNKDSNPDNFESSLSKSLSVLKHLSKETMESYSFNDFDKTVITNQVKNLHKAYPYAGDFNPVFPGYSLILESEGDIIVPETLVEIKAADRKVSSGDIKQVLTYVILNHLSKEPRTLLNIELYNPRHGNQYSIKIDDLCSNISSLTLTEMCLHFENYIDNISSNSN
ncbi:MAG: hypothetical protein ABIJ59_10110 [Pseudomonadota bacterium]